MAAATIVDVEELLAPISDAEPAGPNLRYEPEYGEIEEAVREDEDTASQGEWARDRKVADWAGAIELGEEFLRSKSKDLRVAAWLTEALTQRHGLTGLRDGAQVLQGLQERFWKTVHPVVEEPEDIELREGVYESLDDPRRLPLLVRRQPLTSARGIETYSFLKYQESRESENKIRKPPKNLLDGSVPTSDEMIAQLASEGKIRAEDFDKAVGATTRDFYAGLETELKACLDAVRNLNESNRSKERFGPRAPVLGKTEDALAEVLKLVQKFLKDKGAAAKAAAVVEEPEPEAAEEEAASGDDAWGNSWGDSSATETAEAGTTEATGEEEAAPDDAPAPAPVARVRRSRGGVPTDPEEARLQIEEAARFLRQNDPNDPTGYLVARALGLGSFYGALAAGEPPSLAAPETAVRQSLRRLAADGSWSELVEPAETALGKPGGGGWLDAHRYALLALEGQGYEGPTRAARALLAGVLRDAAAWTTFELDDGTPCANGETRAWLEAQFGGAQAARPAPAPSLPPLQVEAEPEAEAGDGANGTAAKAGPPDPWTIALQHVQAGHPMLGMEVLAEAVRQARSGRERFLRGLQQAELCLDLGKAALAVPLVEDLSRQVDDHRLEQWEDRALCARVFARLYQCLKGRDDERAKAAYRRLCLLDFRQAMAMGE